MITQHTPGPWRTEKWCGEYQIRRPSPAGMPTEKSMRLAKLEVARIPADHSNPEDDGHGNARLIAAAPDLLRDLNDAVCEIELCRAVLKDYARGLKTDPDAALRRIKVAGDVAENARAAITKATHET